MPPQGQKKEGTGTVRNARGLSTLAIYNRFRRAKDRRREKLRRKELEDENERRKVALKKGGGKNLQSVDSFGKQAASAEFSDSMATIHNSFTSSKDGKVGGTRGDALTKS